jgi:predicted RNase H-like nuclease (RuvC/YqgF family)
LSEQEDIALRIRDVNRDTSLQMDPLSSIQNSTLSLCGIFARLSGKQVTIDKALEECLALTKNIDNNACLLDAAATNARKANARLSQEKYKLNQQILKLEKRNRFLDANVQNITAEKEKLDASLSSLFSDDEEESQSGSELKQPDSQPSQRKE